MEMPRIPIKIQKKNNKRECKLPDFKTHCKPSTSGTYGIGNGRYLDECNRIERPKVAYNLQAHLIFSNGAKAIKIEEANSFHQMKQKKLDTHREKYPRKPK